MRLSFIAFDAMLGKPMIPQPGLDPGVADLLSEMRRLHIRTALVRHRYCLYVDPYEGNDMLMREIAGHPELVPAWAVTPDGRVPNFDVARVVRDLLAAGAKAAWIRPSKHGFSPEPWCCGKLYEILSAAKIPLLAEYGEIPAAQIHGICSAFPELRLVLVRVPREGRNRLLYPLLEAHANLHLCADPSFCVHGGLQDLCDRFGPQRWVFGTTYPTAEGGAAVTGIMFAGLPDSTVLAIASGNAERLLAEVRTDAI